MLYRIKAVKYVERYKLQLTFYNGDVRLVDFETRLETAKNMFLPLRDIEYFKQVACDGSTIVWPNGLDLCPDNLHDISEHITTQVGATDVSLGT